MPLIKSFCPGGVTSFFEPYKLRSTKKTLKKELKIGARGGGFTLKKGTTTWIQTSRAKSNKISIFIRKKPKDNFHTTRTVAELLLKENSAILEIKTMVLSHFNMLVHRPAPENISRILFQYRRRCPQNK